jgi:hypothetical protein
MVELDTMVRKTLISDPIAQNGPNGIEFSFCGDFRSKTLRIQAINCNYPVDSYLPTLDGGKQHEHAMVTKYKFKADLIFPFPIQRAIL